MGNETTGLEQLFTDYPQEVLIPILIGLTVGFLLVAFLSYRFLKLEIVLSAILAGYEFGAVTLALAIGENIGGVDVGLILGIACAILFGLLAVKIYKAYIYIVGALLGFAVSLMICTLVGSYFGSETIGLIAGIILGIILLVPSAKLFYKIFKPFYIIITSIAGMVLAAEYLSLIIFGFNEEMLTTFILGGFVMSIPAMIVQFKINKGRTFDED